MRTTLALDSDVVEMARALAASRRITLGEAVSYLARRGAEAQVAMGVVDGFPVFQAEGQAFGPDETREAADADDAAYAKFFLKSSAQAK